MCHTVNYAEEVELSKIQELRAKSMRIHGKTQLQYLCM